MQTFNNVKTSGWSSSPMHGPVRFTKLKKIFIWMVWSCLKTLKILAGPCSPTHGPVLFTVWNEFFICLLCSRLEPFKFMAGPRSPLSLVTAQLIWHRWRTFLSWYYADFQQRLNERLVVLPQAQSTSFHGVDSFVRLDGMKLFKTIKFMAGPCSPKHGLVPFTV